MWSKQYEAAATHDIPAMGKLMEYLPSAVPPGPPPVGITHGDFRIDNMIYKEGSADVAAVLDWELSTIGHPQADLAYACMPYHMPTFPGSPVSGFGDVDVEALGLPTELQFMQRYYTAVQAAGAGATAVRFGDDGLPEHHHFFLAFSFFRIASILQGVYKRSLAGNASADNAAVVGKLAENMADVGWKHAQLNAAAAKPASPSYAGSHALAAAAASTGWTSPELDAQREQHNTVPRSAAAASGAWPVPAFPPPSDFARDTLQAVREFVQTKVLPVEVDVLRHQYTAADRWTVHHPAMEDLKQQAKAAGLWNLFMPRISDPEGKYGPGLTNLEYATMAEETGRSLIAPEVFNCSAPDTGNMEVLTMFGSEEQKQQWLLPLLAGDIRSCFAMTEPGVASSDATNMEATMDVDGDDVVLNGVKWWTSGAMDNR